MEDIKLIEWLKKVFKLNSYEAEIYLVLLKNKKLTAGEIIKLTNVPRSRVYDTLDNLHKKGLINVILEDESSTKYIPISPQDLIDLLKRKEEINFVSKILSLEKLKESEEFYLLQEIYNQKPISLNINNVILIRGTRRIYHEITKYLNKFLKEELIIASDSKDEINTFLRILSDLRDIKKKKIKITISYEGELNKDDLKILHPWEIEIKKEKVGRFVIIDDQVAIIFLKFKEDIINEVNDYALIGFQKGLIYPLKHTLKK